MANHDFFQNKQCEFFPCHAGADPACFSCLFCYCPLYALANQCGGDFVYTKEGIKDCSNCMKPHRRENYPAIIEKAALLLEMTKKKEGEPQNP